MAPCPCCSGNQFEQCCKPYLSGEASPDTAEKLMRSRYSAYVKENFQYVLDTYAEPVRQTLTTNELKESAEGTEWLALAVEDSIHAAKKVVDDNQSDEAYVTFTAFYAIGDSFFKLHETSRFVKEAGIWRYIDGDIHPDSKQFKPARNEACFCGSGKKFKRCCGARAVI